MKLTKAIGLLDKAGLWEEMFAFMELEPLPAGQYILEEAKIADPGPVHLAGDGAGGAYVGLSTGAVLYLDSEGRADVIGQSEAEVLSTALGLPGLNDTLGFTADPDLETARAAYLKGLADWGIPEGPSDAAASEEIAALLGVSVPEDPFAVLHAAVHSASRLVQTADGRVWPGFGAED